MNFSRGAVILDFIRKFKLASTDGAAKDSIENEYTRLYNISIPLNAPYEEVYGVLAEAISDVKKMEEEDIKRRDDAKAKEAEKAESVEGEIVAEVN